MAITISSLAPYLSLGLLISTRKRRSVRTLHSEIEEAILADRPSSEIGAPSLVDRIPCFRVSGVEGIGVTYRVLDAPTWMDDQSRAASGIEDHTHHLLIVLKSDDVFAVFSSHGSDWGRIRRGVAAGSISNVRLAPSAQVNGAFTDVSWPMPTVWMKGLHRSVAAKADSKLLSGPDIRQAIDPFSDQTYSFSSGRSQVDEGAASVSVGISPSKARIWMGASADFTDFCTRARWAMQRLAHARSVATPIDDLAQPIESTAGLGVPSELGWSPQGERSSWSAELVAAFDLLEECSLALDTAGAGIASGNSGRMIAARLCVIFSGALVAEVNLRITYPDAQASVRIDLESVSPGGEKWLTALQTVLIDEQWVTLRYATGEVVSGTTVYRPHYATKPFSSWIWNDFGAPRRFDITKEKPMKHGASDKSEVDLERIGSKGDDSLFSWAHERWGTKRPGLLLCDDGRGELADFLHLSPSDQDGISTLTFVHAKASGSAEATRQLSVSDHEVVVSQAIKNLAYAEPKIVIDKLRTKSKNARLWRDGVKATGRGASGFAAELATRGDHVQLRIVIIQPRTRQPEYTRTSRQGTPSVGHRQLSTLLLEAEAACRGVGASFAVVGSLL